ncbi:MAG TPA: beta-eliminating lyase-related protein [Kofleriaceae bacterium]|nr:beta-eliminating lyase-related protein [Kofleriaceae bacterium]
MGAELESPSQDRPRRDRAIEHAGYNVLNLDGADVRVDLFSDVPPAVVVPPRADTRWPDAVDREPALEQLADRLYGRRCFATIKGRGAEVAVLAALARRGGVVVGHPLFMTLEHAIAQTGARYELAATVDAATADLDVAWLDDRLGKRDVWMVCVEAATNALGGRPIRLANLVAIHEVCRSHGVTLLLDATRLLTNCHLLGLPILEAARAYAAAADVVSISAAKELLVPHGGLVSCADEAVARAAYAVGRWTGTLLEPLALRRELARGIERVLGEPAIVADRARQVAAMTASLVRAGVPVLEPEGGHAAYVVLDEAALVGGGARLRALESQLYVLTGIRTMISKYPARRVSAMRLALAIGRYPDAVIEGIGPAVRGFLDRLGEAPALIEADHRELRASRTRYVLTERTRC